MTNELMTLDGLINRLQEIRECINHNCNINVQVERGNQYSNGTLSMIVLDFKNNVDSVLIQIDYDTLRWFER